MHYRRFLSYLLASAMLFGSGQSALAAAPELGYDLSLTTDYMFRGVSQTRSDPAIQASVSFDSMNGDSGWYGGLWASNVDYFETPQPDDGARIEVDLLLGYQHPFGDRLALDLAVTRYMMPGTIEGIDYDYNEWIATVYVDERHAISVAYTDDVFGSGETGWHYLAATSFELPREFSLELQIGSVDLRDAYGESYQYAGASLLRTFRQLSTRLDYWATSSDAKQIFDESLVTPRFVLTVSVSFD